MRLETLLIIRLITMIYIAATYVISEISVSLKPTKIHIGEEVVKVNSNTASQRRDDFINQNVGLGNVIDSFVVDKGHKNGAEIHSVTDTGIIIIHNLRTKKLITKLIARPEQIRKLYRSAGREPPKKVIRLAYRHNNKRYNEI